MHIIYPKYEIVKQKSVYNVKTAVWFKAVFYYNPNINMLYVHVWLIIHIMIHRLGDC